MDGIIAGVNDIVDWSVNSIQSLTSSISDAACMNYETSPTEAETLFSCDETAWILGNKYSTLSDLEDLNNDIRSRIWITYRRNFPELGEAAFTSDSGWGCMLRCGQMILAEAMIRDHLGRQWVWNEDMNHKTYLKILQQFEDNEEATYSLHKICQTGDKLVGEWYGPNTIAQALKKVSKNDTWNNFNITVALNNILILDEIRSYSQENQCWKPLVLIIPLRLGITEINTLYIDGLKKCFEMPQSIGLIGGKPNHALYFIGYCGDALIYLDPHTTQESGSVKDKNTDEEKELDKTYHCEAIQHMPFSHLDPSLSICFVCSTEKEFDDLCNRLRHSLVDSNKSPLVELFNTRPNFMREDDDGGACGGTSLQDIQYSSEDDDNEFEVLEV